MKHKFIYTAFWLTAILSAPSAIAQEMCRINGSSGICKINPFIPDESDNDKGAFSCQKLKNATYVGSCKSGVLEGIAIIKRNGKFVARFSDGYIQYPWIIFDKTSTGAAAWEKGNLEVIECMNFVKKEDRTSDQICQEASSVFGSEIFSKSVWQGVNSDKLTASNFTWKSERSETARADAKPKQEPRPNSNENNNKNKQPSTGIVQGTLGIEFAYVYDRNSQKTSIVGRGGPCTSTGFDVVRAYPIGVTERGWYEYYSFDLVDTKSMQVDISFSATSRTNYAGVVAEARKNIRANERAGMPTENYERDLAIGQCAGSSHRQYADAIYQFHKLNWKNCPNDCSPDQLKRRRHEIPFSD